MNNIRSKIIEPIEAFPYAPPSKDVVEKYKHIFKLSEPLKDRYLKLIFDKVFSFTVLLFVIPVLLFLKILYLIEGILIPANRGPMLFY